MVPQKVPLGFFTKDPWQLLEPCQGPSNLCKLPEAGSRVLLSWRHEHVLVTHTSNDNNNNNSDKHDKNDNDNNTKNENMNNKNKKQQ